MLANSLELAGFASLTAAAYEWAGRPLALLTLAVALFTLALAAEGVHPLRAGRAALLGRWQAFRAQRAERSRLARAS